MEQKKEDRRVRKTKRLLRHGLSQLMLQKSIKDITVRELAELVDINRGTFYIHYRDIYDMVSQVEAEMFEEFSAILARHENDFSVSPEERAISFLEDAFAYIADNKDMCMALLGKNGDIAFLNDMQKIIQDKCLQMMGNLLPQVEPQILEYHFKFISAGCTAVVRSWLVNGMNETPAQIARLAYHMIVGSLAQPMQ